MFDYDVLIIGSGFGGSVSALRLTEKGYRVGVLEAGRRFADEDFAETNWQLRKFLFAPKLGCMGIQRIHFLPDVIVLAGAGVGGGSLVYANTLYEPRSSAFYEDQQWGHITDWREELAPFYAQAKRMLGVRPNPTMTEPDHIYREVAEDMGVANTFRMTPVGVFFGPGEEKTPGAEFEDPFFGGAGPARRGCLECGACMTGCRHNAKNTLVKNYLYLAERAGAEVHPETTVVRLAPLPGGGYGLRVRRTGDPLGRLRERTLTAEQVIVAAGTMGTQRLLHRMKADGVLPGLSDRLGLLTRTNSEALAAAVTRRRSRTRHDFTRGVAITSSFHPDEHTHIEPCRYGHGSGAMGLLGTVMTDGGGRVPRPLKWLAQVVRHPGQIVSLYEAVLGGSYAERTTIALVMQTLDNSLTLFPKRGRLGRFRLSSRQGHGLPNPTWIPAANAAVRRIAKKIDGFPGSGVGEIFDVPMTAHFLGGVTIGDSAQTGVIDPYHRVYGHPGLHVMDGSAISANIGVNPSLTITAQTERATAMWPNRGEPDPRPAVAEAYRPVAPVPPRTPVVPAGAPAALRLDGVPATPGPVPAGAAGRALGETSPAGGGPPADSFSGGPPY